MPVAKAIIDALTKLRACVLATEVRELAVAFGAVNTNLFRVRGDYARQKAAAHAILKWIATARDITSAILACAMQLGFFVVVGVCSL